MKYFLCGDNDFLIDRRLDELVEQFTAKHPDGEVINIDIDEQSVGQITGQLVAMSLLASYQCFVIRGVTGSSELWSMLETVLLQVPDSNTVIMTHLGEVASVKNYAITRTYKSFKSAAVEVEKFTKPKKYEINDWLKRELTVRKIKFQPAAINLLADIANSYDNPQQAISSELDKLAILNSEITLELIEKYAFKTDQANVFNIFDLALLSDRKKLVYEIELMRNSGADPYQFMGLVTSQLWALVVVVYGVGAKVNPYQLKNAESLARQLGDADDQRVKVDRVVELLADADRKIKLSKPDEAWTIILTALATI